MYQKVFRNLYLVKIICISIFFLVLFSIILISNVHAATLAQVRDLISSSAPATTTNHVIDFTVANDVPPSGEVSIFFEEGGMDIPVSFAISDIDLSYATSTIYYERDLAALPSAVLDGVTIVSGLNGSISFDLNSSSGFDAGDKIRVEFGATATYGGIGIERMVTSATTGPYRVLIETRNTSDIVIDYAHAMFFLISTVGVGPINNIDDTPPVLSNGLPAGLLPGGTVAVMMSVETDQLAHCRYDTSSGTSYASSTNDFDEIYAFLNTVTL